jgi:hypothetical protein
MSIHSPLRGGSFKSVPSRSAESRRRASDVARGESSDRHEKSSKDSATLRFATVLVVEYGDDPDAEAAPGETHSSPTERNEHPEG